MFNQKQYIVSERTGMMKMTDAFDILHPESGEKIGVAQEKVSTGVHMMRMLLNKQMLPTKIEIAPEENGTPLVTISRGFSMMRVRSTVTNASGEVIGMFQSRMMSRGLDVLDAQGEKFARLECDWKGFNFKFLDKDGNELGTVSKKFAGLAKELFTSADKYMVDLNGVDNPDTAALLLAASVVLDTLRGEKD